MKVLFVRYELVGERVRLRLGHKGVGHEPVEHDFGAVDAHRPGPASPHVGTLFPCGAVSPPAGDRRAEAPGIAVARTFWPSLPPRSRRVVVYACTHIRIRRLEAGGIK
eukprot:scaffold6474_cov139-Isochrysis_galbana.AAC.2